MMAPDTLAEHSAPHLSSPVGRFAPSPTGRMHLGNIFTALISWLSVKKRSGKWILRVEDLDPQRSRPEYEKMIEDDLLWLGLSWDEGGLDEKGPNAPYLQSRSHEFYQQALDRLIKIGHVYRCTCRRADLHAPGAPHASDGRIVYNGHCRPASLSSLASQQAKIPPESLNTPGALRLYVPPETITFSDTLYGTQKIRLDTEFGDFLLQRADGAWAYQLAVVADDARMGVTEVVRGHDLLSSSAPQIFLYRQLGLQVPAFAHVPLLCAADGRRLSKRDADLSMETLRRNFSPEELTGRLAFLAGLLPEPLPITPTDLLPIFSWDKIPRSECLLIHT